jgi:hypothetical protein
VSGVHRTFVFGDLAGYTALIEERGDEAALHERRDFSLRGVSGTVAASRLA